MQTVDLSVAVPKESYEAIDAMVDLFEAIAKEAADGFDVTDLPAVLSAAMSAAVEAADYAKIQAEFKRDPVSVVTCLVKKIGEKFG